MKKAPLKLTVGLTVLGMIALAGFSLVRSGAVEVSRLLDAAASEISAKKTLRDPVGAAGGWMDAQGRRVEYSQCSEALEGGQWVIRCACRDYSRKVGQFRWEPAGQECGVGEQIAVRTMNQAQMTTAKPTE